MIEKAYICHSFTIHNIPMVNLDQDHATLRVRYDSAKPIHQIAVNAITPAGEHPRVYIYEMIETIPPGILFGKTVSLNYVSTLDTVGVIYTLVAGMKYYIVAVSDSGALYHEKL